MPDKEKATVQEQLATLYLRLNGYFTTGCIIHSNEKKIAGELDILAVRFPLHRQDDTEHNSSEFLELSDDIDVIIAEVKSLGQPLQFNECIRQQNTPEPLQKLLRWTGIIEKEQIEQTTIQLNPLVQPKPNTTLKTLRSTEPIETKFGKVRIRPVLFSPERIHINNADKFIYWTEINNFLWLSLCPSEVREPCETRYDFTAWGQGFTDIITAYKDRQKVRTNSKGLMTCIKILKTRRNKTKAYTHHCQNFICLL